MSNVRSLQNLIQATQRINTTASCRSPRVLPRALFQQMPPEVTASESVEVLSVNTSGLLVGFAQQGPVHGAFAHMAGSSSSQFMKGASRRRAAPGSRPVEVAARAATCPASNEVAFARERPGGSAPCEVRFPFIRPSTRSTPQSQAPKACGSPRPCAGAAPTSMARYRRRRRNTPTPAPLRVRSGVRANATNRELSSRVGGLRKRTHEPWHEAT